MEVVAEVSATPLSGILATDSDDSIGYITYTYPSDPMKARIAISELVREHQEKVGEWKPIRKSHDCARNR